MPVYLVAFDLLGIRKNYDKIQAFVTKYDHRRLSDSSYVIESDKVPAALLAEVQRSLKHNDILYIFSIKRPIACKGEPETNKWISKNL